MKIKNEYNEYKRMSIKNLKFIIFLILIYLIIISKGDLWANQVILLNGYWMDSLEYSLSFPFKNINIINRRGNVTFYYSEKLLFPKIIVKKIARGEKERFLQWIKLTKIELKEEKKLNLYEIKVNIKDIPGIDNKNVDIFVFLPYNMNTINVEITDGNLNADNVFSEMWNIMIRDGNVILKEIKKHGNIKIIDGNIKFYISHTEPLCFDIEVIDGNIFLIIPSYTKVVPEIVSGQIKGDLFYQKKENIFQMIKCRIIDGTLKIKREE